VVLLLRTAARLYILKSGGKSINTTVLSRFDHQVLLQFSRVNCSVFEATATTSNINLYALSSSALKCARGSNKIAKSNESTTQSL